jgi:murein DD-endopeptidase MepM/ murein hydrolase activator NlpD
MLRFKLFVVIIWSTFSFGQEVLDTLYTPEGTMIIYTNRTWEYLEDRGFDGVMNSYLHEYFQRDSTYGFSFPWDPDVCYTSNRSNDLSKLKDTLWLCVVDSTWNEFVMPWDGVVTSRYGYRKGRYHNGIDINLDTGDTVVAAFAGKVRYAKYNESGFGNLVIIRHYNGLETFYAHLSKHLVVPNQEVQAGEPIGLGGNTGRSRGAHLHFETRFFDAPINPEEIIDFEKKELRDENLFIHRGLFRPGAAVSNNSGPVASSSNAPTTSSSGAQYHKIRSGDTLGHIARRYGTTISRICQLNGISPTTTLHIGRTLRVK